MPSISFKFDKAAWNKSIRDVVVATKRDEVDVVNRALLNVGYRAAEYTPFRSPEDIQQELLNNKTLLRIVTARLARLAGTKTLITRGKRAGKVRKHGAVTRARISAAANRLLAKRKAGSRASRAGWFPGIKAMGGTIRGGKLKSGGAASRGYGTKATMANIEGLIANAYYGILSGSAAAANKQAMIYALQRAITRVRRENTIYAMKKIGATLRRLSH